MWSVGCILGELIIGKAIFPGTSTLNQIERVLELTGRPKSEDIDAIESQVAWNILTSINPQKKRSFQSFFQGASEEALDLLKKLLIFNPNQRLTAEQALKHKYVKDFSQPEEEIVCSRVIKIPKNDNVKGSVRDYREAIYQDIIEKKRIQRQKWTNKYLERIGVNMDEGSQQNAATGNNRVVKKDQLNQSQNGGLAKEEGSAAYNPAGSQVPSSSQQQHQ